MSRYMKTCLVLILAALMASPTLYAQQTAPAVRPKDFENSLEATLEIIKEAGLDDDPVKNARLNSIAYRVAQRANADITTFSFRIVKMEEPNAFALPGGFIFVTTGMMDLDLTDDELAALLGHEITHVVEDHSHKMAKRQTLMNLLYQALIIGVAVGIKDNSGYNPATGLPKSSAKSEILQGSQAFGMIFQELLLEGFSREMEMQADHEGTIAAARAGFDPKGTTELFEKMHRSMYEAPGFGYWRSHPYLEDRMETGRVLAASLEASKNPADATDYRLKCQQTFMKLIDQQKDEAKKLELRKMALAAYPHGPVARDLQEFFIKKAENEENKKEAFFRDYGKLIKLYEDTIAEASAPKNTIEFMQKTSSKDDPETAAFAQKLQTNLDKVKAERDAVKPSYEDVIAKQMFDTDTLKRYLSNFPDSPQDNEIRFRLAENYRITKKEKEAVDLYLEILKSNQDSEWKTKSKQSLLVSVSNINDLSSCYKIAQQTKDPELMKASQDRMNLIVQSFSSLQNGYEFRRAYPKSTYEKAVLDQMNKIASNTLHQAKLYQAIGEYQKALDSYNQILRYCSDLPIANEVKDTIVDFQAAQSNNKAS